MFDTFSAQILDNPVAASFRGDWSQLALREGTASVPPGNVGNFADPGANAEEFAALIAQQTRAVLVLGNRERDLPYGIVTQSTAHVVQMVRAPKPLAAVPPIHHAELTEADRPQMLRLAQETKAGPFEIDTPSLGPFLWVKDCGRLVAMAGTRMGFEGWTEISGVCIDPMYRGLRLARLLVTQMVRRIEGQAKHLRADFDQIESPHRPNAFCDMFQAIETEAL